MITVVFWTIFTVYRVFTNEPSPNVPPDIIEPLNPVLDAESLDSIEGRLFFSEEEIGNFSVPTSSPFIFLTPRPSPTTTPTPVATESATPTP